MEKLGIQTIPLLAQVINFLILLIVLRKLLYAPIMRALDDRRKKIEEGLKATDRARQDMEKSEKKQAEVLNKAKDEARAIIAESKSAGKKVEAEIIEKAHLEAAAIQERARKDIETQRAEMEKELKSQTVEIAAAMAQKIVSDVLSDQQASVLDKKIRDLAKLQA